MEPFWLAEAPPPARSPRVDGPVDVAIVGAGITGCACALALAKAGRRVRIHEARTVASGASGRNGGFTLRGGAARYDVARESYGAEAALGLWRRTETALDRLESLAGDELPPRLAGTFQGAIFHPRDGAIQPAIFVRRLAAAAAEAGAQIVEHDRVESLDALDADEVVVATDGYGHGLIPELDDAIWPARGQVVATEPLPERLFDYPHYARQGFDYWQQLPGGRLVLGGFRDFSIMSELTDVEETTPMIQEALDTFLAELVGYAPPVSHRWAGIFGLTQDFLPLVGRVRDGVWIAAGYSGHGNVLGFLSGELVAEAILGTEDPLLALFDARRLI